MAHRTHRNTQDQEATLAWDANGPLAGALELLVEQGFEGLAEALELLLNEAMKIERMQVLEARPYERTPTRRGQANGFKPKSAGRLDPQGGADPGATLRHGRDQFASQPGHGAAGRRTDAVAQLAAGPVRLPLLDARYEHVRVDGNVVSCALLIAIGITADGRRSVVGVSVSLSEAEVHWREFLAELQARGLHGVKLIVSDDHAGLKAARQTRFVGVPWQRCQFHLGQNLLEHLPKGVSQPEASAELRAVFNAPNRGEADRLLELLVKKYETTALKLAAWLEQNVPEGLTVFSVPVGHRRRLRTNNCLERLNRELKRRTRVASVFPNEASLLRLVTALLMETDDEWQTEKRYLPKTAE